MSNRPTRILALAVAFSATAAAVAALAGFGLAAAPRATPALTEKPAVLLPAVVVRPEAEVPQLGAITVRPSRAERLAAGLDAPEQDDDALARVGAGDGASHALLRGGGGLAMPYYSFGKPLPRTNEE